MKAKLALLFVGTMFILTSGSVVTAQPFLDCSEASVIACGESQTNSTPPGMPGAGNVAVYCESDVFTYEDAWEFVYEFTLESPSWVSIVITYTHISGVNDLDTSVRSICDEDECLAVSVDATGTEEINIELPAGTYYTGIDAYMGQQDGSPHTISIICEPVVADESTTWSHMKALYR